MAMSIRVRIVMMVLQMGHHRVNVIRSASGALDRPVVEAEGTGLVRVVIRTRYVLITLSPLFFSLSSF